MKNSFIQLLLLLLIGSSFFTSCKKEHSCEGCAENKNLPPIAIAGPDRSIALPTDSVSLAGNASSDPDGKISEWLWTKISGPASFNIVKPVDSVTKVKSLIAGTYRFELKVTDNHGLSAKDTLTILVESILTINHPPIANTGADTIIILPVNMIHLDGSRSTDPENNITSYEWSKLSGSSAFYINNPNSVQTYVTNLEQGIYQFELKVTDAGGLFSRDTVNVTVNPAPGQLPIADAGPDIIITLPLDSVYLSGSIIPYPASFQWTKLSGPPGNTMTNFGTTLLVKALIPGLYSFRFEANNSIGMSADTVEVLVINVPLDPNTITFKNLKWRLADEYGTSLIDLDVVIPLQPNLFVSWTQLRPVQIFLQTDSAAQWFIVPSVQAGFSYVYDAASPHIWIMRLPRDDTWVGKESSVKIRLL